MACRHSTTHVRPPATTLVVTLTAILISLLLSCMVAAWPMQASAATVGSSGPNASAAESRLTAAVLMSDTSQQRVTLPHVLPKQSLPNGQPAVFRYRLTVVLDQPSFDAGIYIPKVSRSGRVHLNGVEIGSCGVLSLDRLRCHHQPLFLRAPQSLWKVGVNTIDVDVYATRQQTNGLSEVMIGPVDALHRDRFRLHRMMQVESIDVFNGIMLGLGFLSLLVFLGLKSEPLYLWYGLTCLANAVSNLNVLVTTPWVSFEVFDWLMFSSRMIFTCLLGLTFITYFRVESAIYKRFLLAFLIGSPALIGLSGNDPKFISLLYMPLQAMAVWLAGASIMWSKRSGRRQDWLMSTSFAIMPMAGFLDLARLMGEGSFTGVYLLVYASVVTLALLGMIMGNVMANALATTRNLTKILGEQVEAQRIKMRDYYQRLLDNEQERARSEERERILRDMHDGFLSTLTTTQLALASNQLSIPKAASQIAECIDDLRLILDTTRNEHGSFKEVLIDYHHRVRSRLRHVGIETHLDHQLNGVPSMSARTLLQWLRIVQEAVVNAIKHSGCTTLTIRARWQPTSRTLVLEVADNGRSFDPTRSSGGRGLPNMHHRARELGADLQIDSVEGGTTVRVQGQLAPTHPPDA